MKGVLLLQVLNDLSTKDLIKVILRFVLSRKITPKKIFSFEVFTNVLRPGFISFKISVQMIFLPVYINIYFFHIGRYFRNVYVELKDFLLEL